MSKSLTFAFLLCASNILLNIGSIYAEDNSKNSKPIQENILQILENNPLHRSFHQNENPIPITEDEADKLESVLKNCPTGVQHNIINKLEKSDGFANHEHRFAIFFGDYESNNKEVAAAIAYKLYKQGWSVKTLSAESVFGKNSDHTAIRLANELKAIETSDSPTIMLFSDLNQLLEYNANTYGNSDPTRKGFMSFIHDQNDHDPELTDAVFWSFLNKQQSNKKFFLIGTMNNIQNLPQPTKRRIIMNIVEFPSKS